MCVCVCVCVYIYIYIYTRWGEMNIRTIFTYIYCISIYSTNMGI